MCVCVCVSKLMLNVLPTVCVSENILYKRLAVIVSGPCSVLDALISPAV